jgi:pimeloyl-ACP methyl ester carboxylesterase
MKTDVVLLPGLHGTTVLFDAFIALAPPWARCRPLALPEHSGQTFAALADALEPELQRLEGFILFAESFSAPIAARLARRLGAKISLVVLCNPLTETPLSLHASFAAALIQSRWVPDWAVAVAMTGGNRSLARSILCEVRKLPRRVLADRVASVFSSSREDVLSGLSAPLLCVAGTYDRLISPTGVRDLVEQIPFSIYAEVSGPHLAAQIVPAAVWAAISEEYESAA